jgi:hypothetical protein
MANWIGKVLLTGNEDAAVGILRMLDCSSNGAFDEMDAVFNDTEESVHLLNSIIVMDKNSAETALKKYVSYQGKRLSDDKINKILEKTHCNPPEDYFITSDDMIGKSGVWAHFGSWDFDKALIYNKLKNKPYLNDRELSLQYLKERFNYTAEQADSVYYEVQSISTSDDANNWIAPWPSFGSGLTVCSSFENKSIRCDFGNLYIDVNLTSMDATIPAQQGLLNPNSGVYPTKEGIVVKEFESTVGFSLVLITSEDGTYSGILMTPELATSMFTRLYFMNGHGLAHFKLFSYERSITGNEIYVWKVDWQGKEKNTLDYFKPKPTQVNNTNQENNSGAQIE